MLKTEIQSKGRDKNEYNDHIGCFRPQSNQEAGGIMSIMINT